MEPDVSQRSELQKLAYASLSEYFQKHKNEVISIEILPPGMQPPDGVSMQEGLSLGIAKKALALAYLEARGRFFANKQSSDPSTVEQTMRATEIILLFDPEHITAANFRKRMLARLQAEHGLIAGNTLHKALRQELCFLDSILTSPLHRQSKSPTLWYHRTRVVDPLMIIELSDAPDDQKATFWHKELDAVCTSGEQHPKNYYAWQYARRMVQKANSCGLDGQIARQVKTWCCRHPSDISGWSFLLHLLPRLDTSLSQELVRDVLNYAIKLSIESESLWVFVRTVLAQDVSDANHSETYQHFQAYVEDLRTDKRRSIAPEAIFDAIKWIKTHGKDIE